MVEERKRGRYAFLKRDESPIELLQAPLKFSYLKKSSTYIPLSVIASLFLYSLITEPTDDIGLKKDPLTSSDLFFASAISLNAGTNEEALFRGWMMPVLMEWTASPFWSNTLTALLFGAAHLGSVDTPWAQVLLGWHMGNVTIENGWTLSEAIFIHTWWDVLALLNVYTHKLKNKEAITEVLWLPTLKWHF